MCLVECSHNIGTGKPVAHHRLQGMCCSRELMAREDDRALPTGQHFGRGMGTLALPLLAMKQANQVVMPRGP